jgi:hypothetical protein
MPKFRVYCVWAWDSTKRPVSWLQSNGIRIYLDTMGCVNTFVRSDDFDAWLASLNDKAERLEASVSDVTSIQRMRAGAACRAAEIHVRLHNQHPPQ